MKWLKLWTEARNDGKLRSLSDRHHRIWFRLLCLAGEQDPRGTIKMPWIVLAAEVADNDIEELKKAVARCHDLRLVTCNESVTTCNENVTQNVTLSFHAFEKRNGRPPSSAPKSVTDRVRKHRAIKALGKQAKMKRGETSLKRGETSLKRGETPPDTDADSDNTKKIKLTHSVPQFPAAPPARAPAREATANGPPLPRAGPVLAPGRKLNLPDLSEAADDPVVARELAAREAARRHLDPDPEEPPG